MIETLFPNGIRDVNLAGILLGKLSEALLYFHENNFIIKSLS